MSFKYPLSSRQLLKQHLRLLQNRAYQTPSVNQRARQRCWEADVLPARVIERALDQQIEALLDRVAWAQRAAEIEQARRLL
jgi:hypothetical protein